jgi:hypothetical protein
MAAEFCQHWGNADFATPTPHALVMNAIAQHDNGWYEWECEPEIDTEGRPMDFIHGPDGETKRTLWRRGIARSAAQHPYMGLMLSRHATLLYTGDTGQLSEAEQKATRAFIDEQAGATERMRDLLADNHEVHHAASDLVLLSHTRLLQFGDSSSLQVTIPWGKERIFAHCPVDFMGSYTAITMRWEANGIAFDPWPFGVDSFMVSIHGRLLSENTFDSHASYRAALAAAPMQTLTWRVVHS